jgi:hypothetical protein
MNQILNLVFSFKNNEETHKVFYILFVKSKNKTKNNFHIKGHKKFLIFNYNNNGHKCLS